MILHVLPFCSEPLRKSCHYEVEIQENLHHNARGTDATKNKRKWALFSLVLGSRMVPYGPIWFPSVPYGSLVTHMVSYCPIWIPIVPYGSLLSHPIVPNGSLWSHMDPYGSIWFPIVPYGSIWSHLDPYGPIWIHIVRYGSLLSHGDAIDEKNMNDEQKISYYTRIGY